MKKIKILLVLLATIIGVSLIVPVVIYQRLVNEGSVLADNQCLKVNPLLIERRNGYGKSVQALKDNDTKAYWKATESYLAVSRKYIAEETKWLDTQKKYMDRWDFQYFSPSYVKKAAKYQYEARQADKESTSFIVDAFDVAQLNKSLSLELGKKALEQAEIRNAAEKKYEGIWNNPGKPDWRERFIIVPTSKCPDKNFDFPEIDDPFTPDTVPLNYGQPLS